MRVRRRRGTGSIETLPDGRHLPRLPFRGDRLEPCDTYEEAQRQLDAANALTEAGVRKVGDHTLVGFGESVLDHREAIGRRDVKSERGIWTRHVAPHFRGQHLTTIKRAAIVEWRNDMLKKRAAPGKGQKAPDRKLSRRRVQNALNLVRAVFAEALDRELVKSNPAADVFLPEGTGETHDPWTYLPPAEQRALLVCASDRQRDLIAFALGSGLREGEQWNLELVDADLSGNRITVRYGSNGKPRKKGKILRVKLLPLARAALENQLARLEADRRAWEAKHREPWNPHGLLFPNTRGERRSKGEPSWWGGLLERVGLVGKRRHDRRDVRWHDLRHTCASSLVAGWWGRRWSLDEIQALLGHASRKSTERYAHLAESAVDAAVDATASGLSRVPWDYLDAEKQSHLRDLNPRPTVYEHLGQALDSASLGPRPGTIAGLSERAAEAQRAIAYGGPDGWRKAWDLLSEIAAQRAEEESASG